MALLFWDKAVRYSIAFLFLWLCLATSALADSRVALVIGNSAYAGVGALTNPKDDAALVAETLGGEGFKVTLLQDAKHDPCSRRCEASATRPTRPMGACLLCGPWHRGRRRQLSAAD